MLSVEEWLTIAWLAKMVDAFDAATSTLITILVIFFLQRSRTGFRRTESMINRLVIWTINTGLLTSICAIVALIFVRSLFGIFTLRDRWLTFLRFPLNRITSSM